MKRLRKLIHVALVWTSICLMTADPAAACRLLANRRCCCCCCPATPTSCDEKSPTQAPAAETPAPEASPSDQPRPRSGTSTPSTTNTTSTSDLPPGLPVTLSPVSPTLPLSPTTNVIREPSPAHSPAAPVAGTAAVPDSQPRATTGVIDIGRTNTDNLNTPTASVASPATTEPALRQPADVVPPAVTTVSPPSVNLPSAPAADPISPQPLTPGLTPRQSFATPTVAAPTATSPDREPNVSTSEPTNRTTVNNDNAPLTTGDDSSPNKTDKPLATPAVAQPAKPVATPEFPAVIDDPFAPLVSPNLVPAKTEDHADNPFAPLPAKPAREEQPPTPLVVEPTLKKIDMLAPGSDGRLPVRQWTDNSGTFNVKAQLVLILDGKVRLLKDTGRTTTVAINRLSKADQTYVAEAIQRYGEDLAKLHQLAAR